MLTNWEFEKKYFLHKDMVYRMAFTYMKNVQESEDILQEVVQFWQSLFMSKIK